MSAKNTAKLTRDGVPPPAWNAAAHTIGHVHALSLACRILVELSSAELWPAVDAEVMCVCVVYDEKPEGTPRDRAGRAGLFKAGLGWEARLVPLPVLLEELAGKPELAAEIRRLSRPGDVTGILENQVGSVRVVPLIRDEVLRATIETHRLLGLPEA